jgi:hypothetical protein
VKKESFFHITNPFEKIISIRAAIECNQPNRTNTSPPPQLFAGSTDLKSSVAFGLTVRIFSISLFSRRSMPRCSVSILTRLVRVIADRASFAPSHAGSFAASFVDVFTDRLSAVSLCDSAAVDVREMRPDSSVYFFIRSRLRGINHNSRVHA